MQSVVSWVQHLIPMWSLHDDVKFGSGYCPGQHSQEDPGRWQAGSIGGIGPLHIQGSSECGGGPGLPLSRSGFILPHVHSNIICRNNFYSYFAEGLEKARGLFLQSREGFWLFAPIHWKYGRTSYDLFSGLSLEVRFALPRWYESLSRMLKGWVFIWR